MVSSPAEATLVVPLNTLKLRAMEGNSKAPGSWVSPMAAKDLLITSSAEAHTEAVLAAKERATFAERKSVSTVRIGALLASAFSLKGTVAAFSGSKLILAKRAFKPTRSRL